MPINDYSYQATHDKKLAESICVAAIAKVTADDESETDDLIEML